jgi:hypothetical protein
MSSRHGPAPRWACAGSGARLSATASGAINVISFHNLIVILPEDYDFLWFDRC